VNLTWLDRWAALITVAGGALSVILFIWHQARAIKKAVDKQLEGYVAKYVSGNFGSVVESQELLRQRMEAMNLQLTRKIEDINVSLSHRFTLGLESLELKVIELATRTLGNGIAHDDRTPVNGD
jgi:hypothetical protein